MPRRKLIKNMGLGPSFGLWPISGTARTGGTAPFLFRRPRQGRTPPHIGAAEPRQVSQNHFSFKAGSSFSLSCKEQPKAELRTVDGLNFFLL